MKLLKEDTHSRDLKNVADNPSAVKNTLEVSNKSGEKTALKVNKNEIPVISTKDGH